MNITLTGNLGSGKSSVCTELSALGWDIVSSGDIFRGIAKERGISVEELNIIAKTDKSIDKSIDERSVRLGSELDHTVFDSRLAWHFVEKSYKVFLLVDTYEAAIRVFSGVQRDAEEYGSLIDAQKGLKRRADLERTRFQEIYGIDYYDRANFDLVIESTYATPGQIAQQIDECARDYEAGNTKSRLLINTKCIYPTVPISDMTDDGDVVIGACDAGNFCLSGQKKLFENIKAGDVFLETAGLKRDIEIDALPDEQIEEYASVLGFEFKELPSNEVPKENYLMNIYI